MLTLLLPALLPLAPAPLPALDPLGTFAPDPASVQEPAPGGGRVALADLARVHRISDVDVTRVGGPAVFVVESVHGDVTDREDEVGYRSHLWITRPDGDARPLTHGERGASSPAISPDGSTLAFVRSGEADRGGAGRGQVWLLPLDGPGEARQLTELEHGAGEPRWFPDGASLLVTTRVPAGELEGLPTWDPERPGRRSGDLPEAAAADAEGDAAAQPAPDADLDALRRFLAAGAEEADPTVAFDLDFQGEQGLAGEDRFAHLWRVDVDGGEATELAGGWRDHGGARIAPDGASVVFTDEPPGDVHPDRVRRSALYRLDLASGATTVLFDEPDWSAAGPRWSLAGDQVYFTVTDQTEPTYAQIELARVPAAGGPWERLLPDLDRHVQGLRVAALNDGEAVLFTCPSAGAVALRAFRPATGALETLVELEGAVGPFAAGGGRVVLAASSAANPYELYVRERSGDLRRWSRLHTDWLAGVELSEPRWRWTEAPDGTRVQYWVMPPVGLEPGERAPVVLSLHGGPMVMWGPGSFSMWHEWQWLAAQGYAVVYPNQRGSNGYGRAFQRANHRNWGAGPASDALAALEAAAAEFDWIDAERAVVTGGSYAGYLTAWIVGHDDRFRAAVAQRGVYDLVTFFGEGNAWRLVPDCFGGYPWEPTVREILMRESPFSYVDRITTPLLVMHASQDLRTGVSQSEMLYRALKVLERPVEYVRYPDAGHDLSRSGDPHQRMDRLGRILEFFERFVER